LILHTLLYAAKGPHHLKKAVASMPKANFLATHFFQSIGFTVEPPYRVPRKLRRPDHVTFVANDVGVLVGKLSKQLYVRILHPASSPAVCLINSFNYVQPNVRWS